MSKITIELLNAWVLLDNLYKDPVYRIRISSSKEISLSLFCSICSMKGKNKIWS